VTCSRCEGDGGFDCPTTQSCASCRGIPRCRECGGSGYTSRQEWRGDEKTAWYETITTTCDECSGSGTCWRCSGDGSEICSVCRGSGWLLCDKCDGHGHLQHDACLGTGYFTSYFLGTIERRPEVTKVVDQPKRLPFRVERALRNAGWQELSIADTTTVVDGLRESQRAALVAALGTKPNQVGGMQVVRTIEIAEVSVPSKPGYRIYAYPSQDGGIDTLTTLPRRTAALIVIVAVAVAAVIAIIMAIDVAIDAFQR
jgi:hypothetical protein